ncbi:MAG: hypothetical protein AB8G26_11390 [Ilumatobacter sp.]
MAKVAAISAIALFATACGATTTSPDVAVATGSAGSPGEGAAPVDATSERDEENELGRTPTEPSAETETTAPDVQPTPESTVPADADDIAGSEGEESPDDDEPGDDDPPVNPPVTIPPVLVPTPPVVDPTPTPTVPPVIVTPTITVPPVGPAITIPPVIVSPLNACGFVGSIPGTATIVSDISVDLDGDGDLDQAISFVDAGWSVRTVVDGVTSQIDISGVGPHAVTLLGGTDVAWITPGDELIATVGGGASSVEVGVIGVDDDGCVFQFDDGAGESIGFPVGATVTNGSGVFCAAGSIHAHSFELQPDDTFSASASGYHEVAAGTLDLLPGSPDFNEGLSFDDLQPATLDCDGIAL